MTATEYAGAYLALVKAGYLCPGPKCPHCAAKQAARDARIAAALAASGGQS